MTARKKPAKKKSAKRANRRGTARKKTTKKKTAKKKTARKKPAKKKSVARRARPAKKSAPAKRGATTPTARSFAVQVLEHAVSGATLVRLGAEGWRLQNPMVCPDGRFATACEPGVTVRRALFVRRA